MSEEKMFDDIQMDLHDPTLNEELYVKGKLRTILAFRKRPSIRTLFLWLISFLIATINCSSDNMFSTIGIYICALFCYICITAGNLITYKFCKKKILYSYCNEKETKRDLNCISIYKSDAKKCGVPHNYFVSKIDFELCSQNDIVMIVYWSFACFRFCEYIGVAGDRELTEEIRMQRNYYSNSKNRIFWIGEWAKILLKKVINLVLIVLIFGQLI